MAENFERQIALNLKLGTDATEQLAPVRVDAYEALSEPFLIVVDVLALAEIELLPNLGLPAAIECLNEGEFARHFHGIVIDACFLEEIEERGFLYRLTLAPSAHFHEQGCNYRIYQGKSVTEVVKDVLERCNIDFEFRVRGGTRALAYCVQYGESDFAFACRLMEEEGLYYFYQHGSSSHKMVICNNPRVHTELSPAVFTFNPLSGSVAIPDSRQRASSEKTFVQSWHERASSGAESKVTMRDYDFMGPAEIEVMSSDNQAHEDDAIEIYRWPGRFYDAADGKALSSVLLESRRAQRLRYESRSRFPGLQTGFVISLRDHPNARFNRKYLITNCRTRLADETYYSDLASSETLVEFTTIPDDVQFRAPIVTPRPIAKGPETAVVVGPPGEEIHVDEYGRVKVQFHWDRDGRMDDTSSCWIRVSQTGGLGNIIIPRIGHEVLVDFINGNPDRPIVVGRVFNAGQMPVYSLPQHKTRVLWRTKTYMRDTGAPLPGVKPLDTGQPGANELRFEDATDKEEVFLHAEKDMNTRIRNNETHHVGGDVKIMVGKNRTETVDLNETISIGINRSETVGGSEEITIGGSRSVTIGNNDSLAVGNKISITAGAVIEIQAGAMIRLRVGGSSITLTPALIKVATKILTQRGQAIAKLQGSMTEIRGTAKLTAKGGIVKIN